MHYHVTRADFNTRTGRPSGAAWLGIGCDYRGARALEIQDAKQFRVPGAERFILHEWRMRGCHNDGCIPGPGQKGHSTR